MTKIKALISCAVTASLFSHMQKLGSVAVVKVTSFGRELLTRFPMLIILFVFQFSFNSFFISVSVTRFWF